MEINVANQRVLVFTPQFSLEEAKKKALDKKMVAFDTVSKVTSFLSRPKDEDFELLYEEHRYQPFWHVIANAKYVYERTANYQIAASGPEVRRVTVQEETYEVTNGHIHTSVLEHCTLEEHEEVLVDGVTGKQDPSLRSYLSKTSQVVEKELENVVEKNAILVPPQTRVSALMRDALSKMIKGIQADKIVEEEVEVACVDLYYHPVYAFQYKWKSKAKEAIVEVDGLTGEISAGNRTFSEYVGKVLNRDFLFDISADAAGMLIPGGSIAVKFAKRYIDTKK